MPADDADPLFVGSLEKGFRLLQAFASKQGDFSLGELAEATGMNKSAVQRFAHTLISLGYLRRDQKTRRLSPGVRLLDLSYAYLVQDRLAERAMPYLINASRKLGRRVNLVERDDLHIVYTVRIPAENMKYSGLVVGRRLPIYCTSGGLAMMSRMPETAVDDILARSDLQKVGPQSLTDPDLIRQKLNKGREDQFVIIPEAIIRGEIAVSSPIIDEHGEPVGAVQISSSLAEFDEERMVQELAPLAVETARALSNEEIYKS